MSDNVLHFCIVFFFLFVCFFLFYFFFYFFFLQRDIMSDNVLAAMARHICHEKVKPEQLIKTK